MGGLELEKRLYQTYHIAIKNGEERNILISLKLTLDNLFP